MTSICWRINLAKWWKSAPVKQLEKLLNSRGSRMMPPSNLFWAWCDLDLLWPPDPQSWLLVTTDQLWQSATKLVYLFQNIVSKFQKFRNRRVNAQVENTMPLAAICEQYVSEKIIKVFCCMYCVVGVCCVQLHSWHRLSAWMTPSSSLKSGTRPDRSGITAWRRCTTEALRPPSSCTT